MHACTSDSCTGKLSREKLCEFCESFLREIWGRGVFGSNLEKHWIWVASFPGPAQLSVAFRFFVRARREPGNEAKSWVHTRWAAPVLTRRKRGRVASLTPDLFCRPENGGPNQIAIDSELMPHVFFYITVM